MRPVMNFEPNIIKEEWDLELLVLLQEYYFQEIICHKANPIINMITNSIENKPDNTIMTTVKVTICPYLEHQAQICRTGKERD